MNPTIFLDANILLELFFSRRKQATVLRELGLLTGETFGASILSLDILFYYAEKDSQAKPAAHNFLKSYEILDMNRADYDWAKANDQADFEDALQVGCALRHGCKKLITLDKQLAKNHSKHIAIKLIS